MKVLSHSPAFQRFPLPGHFNKCLHTSSRVTPLLRFTRAFFHPHHYEKGQPGTGPVLLLRALHRAWTQALVSDSSGRTHCLLAPREGPAGTSNTCQSSSHEAVLQVRHKISGSEMRLQANFFFGGGGGRNFSFVKD